MQTFKSFITESLVNIDTTDITMLYKPLESMVKELNTLHKVKDGNERRKLGYELYDRYNRMTLKERYWQFSSAKLKSKVCKQAHSILPVIIYSGIIKTPMYIPSQKSIYVGVLESAFTYACLHYDQMNSFEARSMLTEFTDIKIKSTIQHELAHWIDDALHNQHLTSIGTDNREQFTKHVLGGKKDVGLGAVEVQAQVHQIALIKKRLGQAKWDKLTWDQMIGYHSSLMVLDNRLGMEWRKIIKHRMVREGILGKNMA